MSISMMMSGAMAAMQMINGIVESVHARDYAKNESKKYTEASDNIQKRRQENELIYNNRNLDILSRADLVNDLRLLEDKEKREQKRSEAKNAIQGSSDELKLAEREDIRRDYADSLAEVASANTKARSAATDKYQEWMNKDYDSQIQALQNQAALARYHANQASQAAANSIYSGGIALGQALGGIMDGDYSGTKPIDRSGRNLIEENPYISREKDDLLNKIKQNAANDFAKNAVYK